MIATTGDPEPELLADLDGERVGRAVPQEIVQIRVQQITENNVNWCGVGAPNEGWARQVFGEPDVERLWEKVAFCMRLDEPDPVEAWREHRERLAERATQLNDLHADALRYRGPGTDLTVGLLSAARWMAGGGDTSTGIDYVANMPTEEIFTTPDARRTEGTIRSSLPLVLSGQVVRGLELTFEQGRAVRVEAETGADLIRSHFATIERRPAWRGRARDEGVSGRPVGDALPRHALRRERDLPHRLRRRLSFPLRQRSGGGA